MSNQATDRLIARHFEERAGEYATHVAPRFDVAVEHAAEVIAALTAGGGTRPAVLDVGCGDGRLARRLVGRATVVAIDRSEALVRLASGGGPCAVLADAHALPVRDASVDVVICNAALPFFARPAVALAEMARVVRPDGLVLVTACRPARTAAGGPTTGWVDELTPVAAGFGLRLREAFELPTSFRCTDPDDLAGFFAGQVPSGGPPSGREQAVALLGAAGRQVSFEFVVTVAHLLKVPAGREESPVNITIRMTGTGSGTSVQHMEIDGCVRDVLQRLGVSRQEYLVAVNEEYASPETPLREGDELMLVRAISGG